MPAKHKEMRCVRENVSASLGTNKPQRKLPKKRGIGKRNDTSPYLSLG